MKYSKTSLITGPRAHLAAALTACALLCLPTGSHAEVSIPEGVVASGDIRPEPFTGPTWEPGILEIGFHEFGSMTIGLGGRVSSGFGHIGETYTSRGEVIVDGGHWDISGGLTVGLGGSGSLIVRSGKVSTAEWITEIGYHFTAEGLVRV